jgi:hypothetical protein
MRNAIILMLLGSLSFLVAACADSPTSASGGGTMRLSLKAISTPPAAAASRSLVPSAASAVDSVTLTRARLVLRDIRFHTSEDSLDYRTAPLVLTVQPGSPLQEVSVRSVPPGTYREIEFEVHRIESTDVASLLPVQRAPFADFLAGERYSIILEGTVYPAGDGSGVPFTFRSRINERQEFSFDPGLSVSETQDAVNVTMLVDAGSWFRSADGLSIVDPRDPSETDQIENNLKSSIRVFEDNDRNGEDD